MSTLIASLKSEISRIARKELKAELLALRKASTAHRSEIAELKRQVKSLASAIKASTKASTKATNATPQEGSSEPGFRFSAERLAAIRSRMGLTQANMAALLGVSYLSVHKWEAGKATPRSAQLRKIASISKMGKREALKQLEN